MSESQYVWWRSKKRIQTAVGGEMGTKYRYGVGELDSLKKFALEEKERYRTVTCKVDGNFLVGLWWKTLEHMCHLWKHWFERSWKHKRKMNGKFKVQKRAENVSCAHMKLLHIPFNSDYTCNFPFNFDIVMWLYYMRTKITFASLTSLSLMWVTVL